MSDSHGRFIWYELMTSDTAGAKAFYGAIMGWDMDEMPMPGMTYTVVGPGQGMGGIMAIPEQAKAMGVPPNWTGYVAVDDVDASVAQVASLGGAVLVPPTDIPDIGRFAVIADPAGAAIAIMTPTERTTAPPRPAQRGAMGHASWRELYAGDPGSSFGFYESLFGWTKDDALDMGPMGTYQLFANNEGVVGGMMKKPEQVPVACWSYYFQVGDIDRSAEQVKAAGGQIFMGPMEVPGGDWIIQGQDPQGAMFALVGTRAGS